MIHPDAKRKTSPASTEDLARCDREIEKICEDARAGIGDANGIYQGLRDWRTERKLIADERKTLKAIKREAGVKGY